MRCGLVVLFVVAGCNGILGLEEPEATSSVVDSDGDGVIDQRDNCPLVVNELQEDRDGDRVGDACDQCPLSLPTRDLDEDGVDDACDSCVLGPQVDDDGDGTMDACDLCPATPTKDQLDTDGDIVGDECDGDVGNAANQRAWFDPFTTISPAWDGASQWAIGADGTSIAPVAAGVATLADSRFSPDAVSVLFEAATDGSVGVTFDLNTCEVICAQGACKLVLSTGSGEQASSNEASPRGTLHVRQTRPNFRPNGFLCELRSGPVVLRLSTRTTFVWTSTTLFATSGSRILGVDVIQ